MGRFSRSKRLAAALVALSVGFLAALGAYVSQPVDMERLHDLAMPVLSSNGKLLELRLNSEGMWRERVSLDEIDPTLVAAVIAYEDRRFFSHIGIDPVAIVRAMVGLVTEGRVVSGASSLTMQVARLLQRDLRRGSLAAKVRQMLYALRLEFHWSKTDILEAYFTLAPYGGNVEGIKAASMAWLHRPLGELTMAEIGLMVALPQAPERRRPDRYPHAAIAAKNHVLRSVGEHLAIDTERMDEHLQEGLILARYSPPSLAPHLLDRNLTADGTAFEFGQPTTIHANWQDMATRILAERVQRLDLPVNGAVLVVERGTGYVRVYVGSADYHDTGRKGAINYLTANRSPGSTLKPLIYAAALDRRLIAENHIFDDRPFQQGGYAPVNFDGTYVGAITLQEALIRSRNIPAIQVLHSLGETSFENRLRSIIGTSAVSREPAGLSLAVGGFYMTPENLAELYLALTDPVLPPRLSFLDGAPDLNPQPFVTEAASITIQRLLAVTLPNGRVRIAKTGTSHKRQDALAVLVTRGHVIVSWFGTADNEPTTSLTGTDIALPFSERLKAAIGLGDPIVAGRAAEEDDSSRKAASLDCPRLISFPEDGEWLRTEDKRITVSGTKRDIIWFLNGDAVSLSNDDIPIATGGALRITADDGECRETVEVFVEVMD